MGDYNVAERVKHKAARNLAEAFPALGEPEMTHVWSGYIGMTWDRFPRVHQLGTDGWAWIGCNGRGVALGTALGREIARALDGEPVQELALPVSEPEPLPSIKLQGRSHRSISHGCAAKISKSPISELTIQHSCER